MPLNPAEQEFFDKLRAESAVNPPPHPSELSLEELRSGTVMVDNASGPAADVSYQNIHAIARDGHKIPVRLYNNNLDANSAILVFYPACGYIMPMFEANAIAASRIAKSANIKVAVVDIRLAPENAFPIPINDARDATQYIYDHQDTLGFDPQKFFIGGMSSGGHTVANIAGDAANNSQLNIRRAICLNSGFDTTNTTTGYEEYQEQDLLCTQDVINTMFEQHYHLSVEQRKKPFYSPMFQTKFTHFPPFTIIVAEYDGMRSNSETYYELLKSNGVEVNRILIPGQSHSTFLMRQVLSDGPDPAEIIAKVITDELG